MSSAGLGASASLRSWRTAATILVAGAVVSVPARIPAFRLGLRHPTDPCYGSHGCADAECMH
jgi:hypothetical protein